MNDWIWEGIDDTRMKKDVGIGRFEQFEPTNQQTNQLTNQLTDQPTKKRTLKDMRFTQ